MSRKISLIPVVNYARSDYMKRANGNIVSHPNVNPVDGSFKISDYEKPIFKSGKIIVNYVVSGNTIRDDFNAFNTKQLSCVIRSGTFLQGKTISIPSSSIYSQQFDILNDFNEKAGKDIEANFYVYATGKGPVDPEGLDRDAGYIRETVSEVFLEFFAYNWVIPKAPIDVSIYTNSNINFSWDRDTTESGSTQTGFIIQISKDRASWTTIADKNESSSSYSHPAASLTQGTWYWKVLLRTSIGNTEWSDISSFSVKGYPTIDNLTVLGQFYEKDILANWRSTNQTGYEYELYYNNINIKTGTGTTERELTIPANTFTGTLPASIRLRVKNEIDGETIWSNWQERSITLKEITPTVSNLRLSGSNIDLDLTFSWDSTDQEQYEVEVLKDSNEEISSEGLTEKQVIYPYNTFTVGLHKFRVRVAYKGRWTDWQEINVTLVETFPSIGVLEPDGVIVERDDQIRVWWTSTNQTEWLLTVDDTVYTYEGTYETERTITPGLLSTGNHRLQLTVTYITTTGIKKTVSKYAEFKVQGRPPIPTFTNSNTFTTNRPTLSWDTQDQQGYLLEILQDNKIVWTTEWQNGLVARQKVLDYLPNGDYIARLKIINQFSIESEYGFMSITIRSEESTIITLRSQQVDNGTYLSWDNNNDKFIVFYIIRNDKVIAKTSDTIYTDYTAHEQCTYIVRGVTGSDVFVDSNAKTEYINIRYGIMATVDKLSDIINVGISRDQYSFSGDLALDSNTMHLSGREFPITIFGEHSSNTYSLTFTREELEKFVELYRRRKVFCYRDKRQKLYLAITNPSYEIDMTGYNFRISATEVDCKEVVPYD